MDRRRFVAGVGGSLTWVAGCAGLRSDSRSQSESGLRSQSETEEGGPRYTLEAYPIGRDGIRVAFAAQAGELPDEALTIFLAALDGSDDPRTSGHREFEHIDFVEYRGRFYRVTVERREAAETEYAYETTKVANSTTAFREFVREEVVDVWLGDSNLSGRQRTIFEEARAGEYAESGDLSGGYRGLLERIFGGLPAETTGARVGYDGRTHKVHVHVSES